MARPVDRIPVGPEPRDRGNMADGERFPVSGEAHPPGDLEERFQGLLADVERASLSGNRDLLVEAARELRGLLAAESDLLAEAEQALHDTHSGLTLRRVLSVVLGSLPGNTGKALVLGALQKGRLREMEHCAIFCLNIVPEESPPLFERDGQPFSVEVAPGLVVFVRGQIEDDATRAVLAGLADFPDDAIRLAVTRVLRDSIEFADVRTVMRSRLSQEEVSDEVRGEAGAALAHWLQTTGIDAEEKSIVVDELFNAMADSGEILHFRLSSPLAEVPLDAVQRSRLYALAASPDEGLRRTITEIVGRRLQARAGTESDRALDLLLRMTSLDTSSLVRETAAMQLRHGKGDPKATAALVHAIRLDADPEVRAAAVSSLWAMGATGDQRDVLLLAREKDSSPMVRAAARRALGE